MSQFFPYISEKYTTGIVYEDGAFNDSRMLFTALLTASQGNGQKMPKSFVSANILNKAEFLDFVKNK